MMQTNLSRQQFLCGLLGTSALLLPACGSDDDGAADTGGDGTGDGTATGGAGMTADEGMGDDTTATGGTGMTTDDTTPAGNDDGAMMGDGTDTGGMGTCSQDLSLSEGNGITSGHAHQLVVSAADIAAGVTSYTMTGGHTHPVDLTDADLQMLQAGQTVMLDSGVGNGHTHQVMLVCG